MQSLVAFLSLTLLVTQSLVHVLATPVQVIDSGLNSTFVDKRQAWTKRSTSADGPRNRVNIYFVRHGDTDWSEKQLIQGQSDLPLNAHGIQEAHAMGEALKHVPFVIAFTSTLQRTMGTLDIIRHVHDGDIFYGVTNQIIGQGMGELTGKPYSTVDWTKPELIESLYKDVEPREDFTWRLERFLGSILAEQATERGPPQEANLLIIGHGTTFIPMIRRLRKLGGESEAELDAALPPYYPIGTIPIVTVDKIRRLPRTELHYIDWEAAESVTLPVSMSFMHVPLPPKQAESAKQADKGE